MLYTHTHTHTLYASYLQTVAIICFCKRVKEFYYSLPCTHSLSLSIFLLKLLRFCLACFWCVHVCVCVGFIFVAFVVTSRMYRHPFLICLFVIYFYCFNTVQKQTKRERGRERGRTFEKIY